MPVILSLHCHHVSVCTSSCFIVHHLVLLGGSYLLERVPVILSPHCHHVSVSTSSCFIGRFIPTGKSACNPLPSLSSVSTSSCFIRRFIPTGKRACNPLPHCHHVSVSTSSCFIGRFIPTGKSACNPLPSLSSRVCLYIILFYWEVHTYWKECL